MESFNVTDLAPRDAARLFMSVVVPRPIGWVSSCSADGARNLAPFSFFNGVDSNPPLVLLSIGRREGQPKDTLRNIEDTGEFVVNIADEALAEAVAISGGEYAADVDEFVRAGLAEAPSLRVRPPRVALAPVALEARLSQLVPLPEGSYTLVIGRVVAIHVREGLVRTNGTVDALALRPLSRLGGDEFATIGQVFERPRPVV